MNRKPLIFISHIKEEKEIALALKKLVTDTFLNMMEVFVSTDPRSIELGREWLQKIKAALKMCSVEVILASPESVKRPWINFEAGAAWLRKNVPVIPLCHSGMTPDKLPSPLDSLQSAVASEEAELKLIFPVLAKAIGCDLPTIDFAPFISTVEKFEDISRQIARMASTTPTATTDGLTGHEFAALIEIAESADAPDELVNVAFLRRKLNEAGYRGLAVTLALQMLGRKEFVQVTWERDFSSHEPYAMVKITPDGWNWIDANQHKLVLTVDKSEAHAPPLEPKDDDVYSEPPDDDVPF
jgi:hypothetical protein